MTRWMVMAGAMACLLGCDPSATEEDPDRGIAVGNPGLLSVSMALTAELEVTAASLEVSSFEFASCGGGSYASASGGVADLADEPEAFDFPAGAWCGVRLNPSGGFHVEATWGTSTIVLDLEVADVSVGADETFDADEESEFAFELGTVDWLDPGVLGWVEGEDVTVDGEHDLHDVLVAALELDSALFDDLDGSGAVEQPERDAGPLATGEIQLSFDIAPEAAGYTADSAQSGCGTSCSASGGTRRGGLMGLALLLLGVVWWGRRNG